MQGAIPPIFPSSHGTLHVSGGSSRRSEDFRAGEDDVYVAVLVGYMIILVENAMDSTEKLMELSSDSTEWGTRAPPLVRWI